MRGEWDLGDLRSKNLIIYLHLQSVFYQGKTHFFDRTLFEFPRPSIPSLELRQVTLTGPDNAVLGYVWH